TDGVVAVRGVHSPLEIVHGWQGEKRRVPVPVARTKTPAGARESCEEERIDGRGPERTQKLSQMAQSPSPSSESKCWPILNIAGTGAGCKHPALAPSEQLVFAAKGGKDA